VRDKNNCLGLLKDGRYFPRVSVVIVNYNGHRWLKLFIPPLVKTQYPDFEIIVVDNASKDESVQFLTENFPHIQLVKLSENKGNAEGTNIGAAHSTGEVLAFLNNDVEVSYDWLTQAISKLTSDDNIAAVQCKIMRYYNRKEIDCVGMSVDRYNFFLAIGEGEIDNGQYDDLDEIGVFHGAATVVWKRIFYQVGCFDDLFFMYHEEVDLCWRIRLSGYKICIAKSSVVYHVGSATSNTRASDNRWNPSPFFAFLNSRNLIYCWLKNSRLKNIIIYWPVFIFVNVVLGLTLIPLVSPRSGIAYIRGLFWPLKHLRHISNERKKMREMIKSQKDNILFVAGIINESSHLSNIVKRAPLRFIHRIIEK
jgi:GT2 family glycosyltransferase